MKKFTFILISSAVFAFTPMQVLSATETGAPVHSESTTSETMSHNESTHTEEKAGLLGTFGVNWKLFLAQLLNFSIILFVLWKWVFGPVSKTMENRRIKIEESLSDADRIALEREQLEFTKKHELAEARKEAAALITEAKKEAAKILEAAASDAKSEQVEIALKGKQQLEQEKAKAMEEIKSQAAELVVAASEKILKAKLDPKKDADLIKKAIESAEERS